MGNSKFLDALNKEQYAVLTKKLWEIQNHKCFICEKDIDLDIKNHFAFTGVWYDEVNLFQQKLPEQLWGNIRTFIKNLRDLPLWKDRSMSSTVFGGKSTYDFWKTIFATGRTPDGIIVLSKPLNVADMIRN